MRSLQSRSDHTPSPRSVIRAASDSTRKLRGTRSQPALTSTFLEGGALGVLPQLGLSVLGQLSQRGGLSLLVLFALAAVVAAFRLPLPPLLLVSTGGRRRLLRSVVDDILLLLEHLGENTR